MTYRVNLFKIFRNVDDHLFRIKKAEKIESLWKVNVFLVICSILVYVWMAYLGIGSNLISESAVSMSYSEYESSKLWFLIGRALFSVIFALSILLLPSLLFHLLTDVPYQKLVIMQQVVLSVMLVERLVWIPLAIFAGLDWYVSPLAFGIIASYLTEVQWVIYFFGAISLFQLWIIWFQAKYLIALSTTKKHIVWINVILFHVVVWCIAALLGFADSYLISGWFE